MSVQYTPIAKVLSRIVASDSKLGKTRRKCVIDMTLPQVLTKNTLTHPKDEGQKPDVSMTETVKEPQKVAWSAPTKRKLEDGEISKAKRFKDLRDDRIVPMYRDYQLLGDSQLVRFSTKLLGLRAEHTESYRRIGYCVSGQTVEDLRNRLSEKEFALHKNVLVLIGTNDFLRGTDYQLMCASYKRLVKFLKKKCSKIILLTVPPVAKFENDKKHWKTLQNFNKFIEECEDDDHVRVVDLCSIFISYLNTVNTIYYEKVYFNTYRTDLIHLNEEGLRMLKFLLELHVFDNEENRSRNVPLKRQLFNFEHRKNPF